MLESALSGRALECFQARVLVLHTSAARSCFAALPSRSQRCRGPIPGRGRSLEDLRCGPVQAGASRARALPRASTSPTTFSPHRPLAGNIPGCSRKQSSGRLSGRMPLTWARAGVPRAGHLEILTSQTLGRTQRAPRPSQRGVVDGACEISRSISVFLNGGERPSENPDPTCPIHVRAPPEIAPTSKRRTPTSVTRRPASSPGPRTLRAHGLDLRHPSSACRAVVGAVRRLAIIRSRPSPLTASKKARPSPSAEYKARADRPVSRLAQPARGARSTVPR